MKPKIRTIKKTKKKTLTVYDNPLKIRIPIAPPTSVHGKRKPEVKRVKITTSNWENA
jgi:hypothetical protein